MFGQIAGSPAAPIRREIFVMPAAVRRHFGAEIIQFSSPVCRPKKAKEAAVCRHTLLDLNFVFYSMAFVRDDSFQLVILMNF